MLRVRNVEAWFYFGVFALVVIPTEVAVSASLRGMVEGGEITQGQAWAAGAFFTVGVVGIALLITIGEYRRFKREWREWR